MERDEARLWSALWQSAIKALQNRSLEDFEPNRDVAESDPCDLVASKTTNTDQIRRNGKKAA